MGHSYDPLRAGVYDGASLVATVHVPRPNSMSEEELDVAAAGRDELGRVVAAAADAYRLYSSEFDAMSVEEAHEDDGVLVLDSQAVDDEEELLSLLLHRAIKRREAK